MYRRNKLEPNSVSFLFTSTLSIFGTTKAKNRLRLMEEMSVRHRNYAIPTTAVCVSPAYKLSKQTCKCDNEKIAINPAQSWEFLKARQFHPQSKDLFPSTHFLGNQKQKYFLRLLPHSERSRQGWMGATLISMRAAREKFTTHASVHNARFSTCCGQKLFLRRVPNSHTKLIPRKVSLASGIFTPEK
jgi:hypothetical protein